MKKFTQCMGCLAGSVLMLVGAAVAVHAEGEDDNKNLIQMTTYFPVPYAAYNNLYIGKKFDIGTYNDSFTLNLGSAECDDISPLKGDVNLFYIPDTAQMEEQGIRLQFNGDIYSKEGATIGNTASGVHLQGQGQSSGDGAELKFDKLSVDTFAKKVNSLTTSKLQVNEVKFGSGSGAVSMPQMPACLNDNNESVPLKVQLITLKGQKVNVFVCKPSDQISCADDYIDVNSECKYKCEVSWYLNENLSEKQECCRQQDYDLCMGYAWKKDPETNILGKPDEHFASMNKWDYCQATYHPESGITYDKGIVFPGTDDNPTLHCATPSGADEKCNVQLPKDVIFECPASEEECESIQQRLLAGSCSLYYYTYKSEWRNLYL